MTCLRGLYPTEGSKNTATDDDDDAEAKINKAISLGIYTLHKSKTLPLN